MAKLFVKLYIYVKLMMRNVNFISLDKNFNYINISLIFKIHICFFRIHICSEEYH